MRLKAFPKSTPSSAVEDQEEPDPEEVVGAVAGGAVVIDVVEAPTVVVVA